MSIIFSRGAAKYSQPRVERSGTLGTDGIFFDLSPERAEFRAGNTPPFQGYEILYVSATQGSASLHPGLRVLRASGTGDSNFKPISWHHEIGICQ